MKRFLRASGILVLLVLLILLLGFFGASSWLETEAGRNLLQRELGKGLGLEATLQGDYALEVYPGLQIAGRKLELSDAVTGQAAAALEFYELHLALWPLLRKQVVIHEVAVEDGFLDLDLLPEKSSEEPTEPVTEIYLPRIGSLQVSGLRLLRSSTALVTVDQLVLENFAPEQDAKFSLGISPPEDGTDTSLVQLRGTLLLAPAPLQLTLDFEDLILQFSDQPWTLGAGQFKWSGANSAIEGNLAGQFAGYSSQIEFSVQTVPAVTLVLSATLEGNDGRSMSGKISARDGGRLWILKPVETVLDGQEVKGAGCFSMEAKPRLHLQLESPELDLEKLQSLLPPNLLPAGTGPAGTSTELPVDLAVELVAGQVSMEGTVAREVRLLLGEPPDCG